MKFYTENPINDKNEDKLNRTLYAENLAESIRLNKENKCLTIGLIGKWGSGKTSIINIAINKLKSEDLIILNFSPWYFSTQDNLYRQFFNLIISEIERREFGNKFWIQKKFFQIETQLKKASHLTKGNKTRMQYFKEIIFTLRELEHLSIVNKYYNQVKSNSSINFNTPGFGYTYNFNDSTKEYNSISYLKTKCNEYFKELGYKFLIIMDDIDRMNRTEIEQTLILVKSVADFDNFTYLLAFDDDIVAKSLKDIPENYRKNYLEKIIPVYLTVPKISETHFDNLISDELKKFYGNFILDENAQEKMDNDLEFRKSVQREFLDVFSFLKLFFKTPRDLYRYINILTFNFSVFKDEVNTQDFMIILAIQLFQPAIYHEIKNNRNLFLVKYVEIDDTLKTINKNNIEEIIKLSKDISTDVMKKILYKLFPKIGKYYRNIEYGPEWDKTWKHELRICNESFFDKYFTLTLGTDELSMVAVNNLLNSNNTDEISNTIIQFDKDNKTKNLFDLIINRMEDIPKNNAKYFISSFIDIGDLIKIPYNMFFDKRIYLSRILDDLLKKYETTEERFEILKEAISNSTNSLYVAIDLLSGFDYDYNRFNYENDKQNPDILITENELEELEEIMKKKIREWDDDGRLWNSPDLEGILYSWRLWESEGYVINRVKEYTSNDENLLTFLNGFKNIVTTTMHENSPNEINYKLNFKSLEIYFDLEELNERLKRMEYKM